MRGLSLMLLALALAACNSSNEAEQAAAAAAHAQNEAVRATAAAGEEARPNVITIGDRSGAPAATFTRTGDSWIMEKGSGAAEPYQIHEEWTPEGPNRLKLINLETVWTFDLDSMQATLSLSNGTVLDQLPILRFS